MLGYKPGLFSKAVAFIVALFLILPILIILPVSLTDQRYLSFPQNSMSMKNFKVLIDDPAWIESFYQSIFIAIFATVLAVSLGTLFAIGCWRLAKKSTEVLRAMMLLPLIIPPVIYAVGLYRYFANIGLLDTFTGVILAHAVTGIPYVIITVSASLSSFDSRLESAALGLGASYRQTLRHVIIPKIAPGIFSGAILVFIYSWDELVVAIFISSRRVFTLPRKIWNGINENVDPTIAAVAIVLIVLTVSLLFTDLAMRRKSKEL